MKNHEELPVFEFFVVCGVVVSKDESDFEKRETPLALEKCIALIG